MNHFNLPFPTRQKDKVQYLVNRITYREGVEVMGYDEARHPDTPTHYNIFHLILIPRSRK